LQSEFLQLFSFVVMAALFIHKGSAESTHGEENITASLRRIEEKLGTLPDTAPTDEGEQWRLPETPSRSRTGCAEPPGREPRSTTVTFRHVFRRRGVE
jgi:hypothetical protein